MSNLNPLLRGSLPKVNGEAVSGIRNRRSASSLGRNLRGFKVGSVTRVVGIASVQPESFRFAMPKCIVLHGT